MKQALLLSIMLSLRFSSFSQPYIISGTVTDSSNGETLIGATVAVAALNIGTLTNEYGFYSIGLSIQDSILLEFSYVGFQTVQRIIYLTDNLKLNVALDRGIELEEVVIKASSFQEKMQSTEMSVEEINTRQTKAIPVILGESDVLKVIQLKPGIPSGSEGTTGLFVRGGGSDQNLIVLDEATVYNANHLFGFFSTFNTDAVKDLKLYKGGFPAQYGGRLSSVIDVKLKEGNNQEFSGSGGLGLIASRLTLEGPIQQGESSFIISGRRTYVDLFTKAVNRANQNKKDFNPIPDYYFYDLNTKINFTLGEKDRLYLSGYFGRDVFGFEGDFFDFNFDWGNATGTVRWNHVFNPTLFANTTFTYSDYQYNIVNDLTGFSFRLGSDIKDANLKVDFYYVPNPRHTIRFGGNITHHQFTVGRLKAGSDDGSISFSSGQNFTGIEMGTYLSDDFDISNKLKLSSGLRFSGFTNHGKTYLNLEPRLSARYIINPELSFKASYARMYQYLHLVANSGVTLPTDIWYPSTDRVKPQRSDQLALGLSYLLKKSYLVTFETYYKNLKNQIEFVDGAELFANDALENEFAIGRGDAYGLEIGIEKEEGKLTGWIGYTLALVVRGAFKPLDESANFAQQGYFSPIYDRRHDLSVVLLYDISKRLSASATFVYGSGDLRWLPIGRFVFQDVYGSKFEAVVPVYEDRNNYRLPPYHRLDLGLIWRFYPKWGESDLTFNVINVYDRRNTFFIYFEPKFESKQDITGNDIEIPKRIVAKQVSLFPILPSVTWNFKF
ncbi:MAG: TonB-dependent receptor [Saprospiraceae bacterium]|nr:TonB-dependent receptor [Saprospiraceae bacterium]